MERDSFEDIRVDGRIILKWLFQEVGWGDWIDLAQAMGRWLAELTF